MAPPDPYPDPAGAVLVTDPEIGNSGRVERCFAEAGGTAGKSTDLLLPASTQLLLVAVIAL